MLVVRRKEGESVLVGNDIEIQVIEISPARVKLGISAPPEVLILRREIRLAEQENVAAARGVSLQAIAALVRRLQQADRS